MWNLKKKERLESLSLCVRAGTTLDIFTMRCGERRGAARRHIHEHALGTKCSLFVLAKFQFIPRSINELER